MIELPRFASTPPFDWVVMDDAKCLRPISRPEANAPPRSTAVAVFGPAPYEPRRSLLALLTDCVPRGRGVARPWSSRPYFRSAERAPEQKAPTTPPPSRAILALHGSAMTSGDRRKLAAGDASTELDRSERPGCGLGALQATAYLLIREPTGARVVEVADGAELVVGRAPEAAIHLSEPRVSRQHAIVARRGAELVVRDLGSRNATAVNGRPLHDSSRALVAGDVIHVGPIEIVVALAAPGSAPSATGDTEGEVIVVDEVMVKLFETVQRVAQAPTTVLVLGETGVGKEIVAEALHRSSPRSSGPFVRLNCAALPESLLESELFGHDKGAFTGANARKRGHIEAANGGTILFDEIGELPLAVQAKLLRVLETRRVMPVGGTRESAVDVRIVCATHRDLEVEASAGRFRPDLYYRISGFVLRVPPLRERPTEVTLLAELFARRFAQRASTPVPVLSPEVREVLAQYAWPGNVRELKNAVEHAAILAAGAIVRAEHLPATVRAGGGQPPSAPVAGNGMRDRVAEIEKKSIEEALAAAGGNVTRTALELGLSRGSLMYKMAKYGLRR